MGYINGKTNLAGLSLSPYESDVIIERVPEPSPFQPAIPPITRPQNGQATAPPLTAPQNGQASGAGNFDLSFLTDTQVMGIPLWVILAVGAFFLLSKK